VLHPAPLWCGQWHIVVYSFFSFFLTWWGAFLIGLLDATMLLFLPFGVDAVVIYLSARDAQLFWIYPLLATAGSTLGAAATYWVGKKIGDVGLERYVPARRLERIRARVRDSGAIALAVPALMPPPFPLTPFILTCGALNVNPVRFLGVFMMMRLVRFGVEAGLAVAYGRGILRILESETLQMVVTGFVVIAVLGTLASAVMLWRSSREPRAQAA
jgi:membrane protein YqaA with SNARE-associated domain